MDKIEDFGVHANQYYPLKVEIYKTKLDEQLLDLLWNKYWVATLSQSLLVSVRRTFAYRRVKLISSTESRLCYLANERSVGKGSISWSELEHPSSSSQAQEHCGSWQSTRCRGQEGENSSRRGADGCRGGGYTLEQGRPR